MQGSWKLRFGFLLAYSFCSKGWYSSPAISNRKGTGREVFFEVSQKRVRYSVTEKLNHFLPCLGKALKLYTDVTLRQFSNTWPVGGPFHQLPVFYQGIQVVACASNMVHRPQVVCKHVTCSWWDPVVTSPTTAWQGTAWGSIPCLYSQSSRGAPCAVGNGGGLHAANRAACGAPPPTHTLNLGSTVLTHSLYALWKERKATIFTLSFILCVKQCCTENFASTNFSLGNFKVKWKRGISVGEHNKENVLVVFLRKYF